MLLSTKSLGKSAHLGTQTAYKRHKIPHLETIREEPKN